MSIQVCEVSDQQVSHLVGDIDSKGFACIPNYLGHDDLERMQEFVQSALQKSNHEYIHFNGPESVGGSGLEELAASPTFKKLIHDIYQRGTGRTPYEEKFYQVLRCLAGKSGQKNSLIFHYDSYIVSALLPIYIPSEGMAGDLLMYPNARKVRDSYLSNAMDKVLLDNGVTQRILRGLVNSDRLGPMRIKMRPGNLYFFWGYRSIHTNEPCDPDKVRATALFHYANPHKNVSG
ncbi:MAG TPA: hypothetical protein VGD59_03830 [Acidisarcina sp.]